MMNEKQIRVAWLAPYPPERLLPELNMVRSSHAHPATWIVNLADALAKMPDVDLHVITATSGIPGNQTVSKYGITFHVIRHTFPFTARGFPPYLRLDLFTHYAQLRRQIRRTLLALQPDVIHVHGTESGYGLAALESNSPFIVSIQGIVNYLVRISPSVPFMLQAPIEREVIRRTKYFGSRTAWANRFIRTLNPTGIIYDMPEAMDPLFFSNTAHRSDSQILFVGSVEPRKGIVDALEAMRIVVAACPAAKLLVVGEGNAEYAEYLQKRVKSAEISGNVKWLGRKTTAEVAALHASSTLLIHPSHSDNSPNSVAEAMASGLPVIASNVGGIPSMVDDGVTGVLTQSGDHRQLAEAIISTLQNEPERRRLADRARKVAFERHFPAVVADKTAKVYRDVIAIEAGRIASVAEAGLVRA
jgi:glycosyltransferase involved in cell wall biosynthesis